MPRRLTNCCIAGWPMPRNVNCLYFLSGIAPPGVRRTVVTTRERARQTTDTRHPLHNSSTQPTQSKEELSYRRRTPASGPRLLTISPLTWNRPRAKSSHPALNQLRHIGAALFTYERVSGAAENPCVNGDVVRASLPAIVGASLRQYITSWTAHYLQSRALKVTWKTAT